MQEANEKEMTFWDHLDELRKVFFRIAIAVILLACIAFLNKETISSLIKNYFSISSWLHSSRILFSIVFSTDWRPIFPCLPCK